ncbi:MAG TPA: VOC family protein [Puia sp.]|nr:VOC family protein [Puia sp.]
MESLTVNNFVRDINKSIDFYKQLGFDVKMTVPEQGEKFVWVMLTNGQVNIMLQAMDSLGDDLPDIDRTKSGGTLLFYIRLKHIRDFFENLKGKVEVVSGLTKTFYGATEFTIKDADGYHLTFAENE